MILNDSESIVFIGRPTNQSPVSFDHFIFKRVPLFIWTGQFRWRPDKASKINSIPNGI